MSKKINKKIKALSKVLSKKLIFDENGNFIVPSEANIVPKAKNTKSAENMSLFKFLSTPSKDLLEMAESGNIPTCFQGVFFEAFFDQLKDEELRKKFDKKIFSMGIRIAEKGMIELIRASTIAEGEGDSSSTYNVLLMDKKYNEDLEEKEKVLNNENDAENF